VPTYKFKCPACGTEKSWKSRWEPDCPNCGSKMKREYGKPGFILKGGGFYSTENRKEG
jgi:putative FmdB family regulatory protein